MKKFVKMLAIVLIMASLLSFMYVPAQAADYINVSSVASTYGIASGTAAYSALSMINNTYASQLTTAQKQGIVVFMFEGAGNDLSASKRMGAMCVVVKNGSVAYLNRNCSTIPDYPFNPAQNQGTAMPTVKSGIYNFTTVNHNGSYAALNVTNAQVVRHNSKTSYYSGSSTNINVHRRSSDTLPSTSAGWVNSAGCFIIGKTGTSSSGEYARFIQAVGIVGSGAAGNAKYSTYKSGKIVVDRSLAGSYLTNVGYSSGAQSLLGAVDESQPPTKSTISISKSTYAVDEDVVFNMSCSGATNTLWVYRVDGQWQKYYENAGSSYPVAFGWAGEYKALVETWNSKGSKISNEVYFTVGGSSSTVAPTTAPSDKPTSATISVNKSTVKVEESITLTFSGNGKTNTLWVYFPNGTSKYYQDAGTSRTMSFANPGKYEALVETWNAAGTLSYISKKISFTVVPADAPTSAKITTNKSSYTTGENVVFSMTTDGKINDLWIYKPDGTSQAYQDVGSSKTLSFTAPGKYEALVQTWNQAGTAEVKSTRVSFTVTAPTAKPTTAKPTTAKPTTAKPTTAKPTTAKPTTAKPTTAKPTTAKPTTAKPTTAKPTTAKPTTAKPTIVAPTTVKPTTAKPTTVKATTVAATTVKPTTIAPTTIKPTTVKPTTIQPTTAAPTTVAPTTAAPTTVAPTTVKATTVKPTTKKPVTQKPTVLPPNVVHIFTDKESYLSGETVNFMCLGNSSDCKLWVFFPDGSNQSFEQAVGAFALPVTQPGRYSAVLKGSNASGSVSSEVITFTVAQPTEPPTMAPTTVPTTTPTTAPTTAPTAATTQPTNSAPADHGIMGAFLWLIIVVIVLAVLCVVMLIMLLRKKKDE